MSEPTWHHLYVCCSILRYGLISSKELDRGLVDFKSTIQDESTKILEYITKMNPSECLRQQESNLGPQGTILERQVLHGAY